ncbi:MAG: peptidoglycan-binding protein [Chloroflexi bacterium AL-W]|nr:peptidoglycan-binding protein [Chloroflexi bacterium AL-N1]NOK69749.1 peptidoglycan-binding protein [Chloroflexi bacterium AL-N10]NOK73647.1 peptidoglycan-binding protein [Chloroflexi bacterium AL-N5]NOK83919.1 peptidoglycan-binding protein [Chloroflexi bacterium AL-W]NOK87978.1 peptidoglycan-binding protein [Chloroflexi bacterium AL-N15]
MRRLLLFMITILLCLGTLLPSSTQAASWPNYERGDSGTNVTTIQYLLRAHGHSLGVDGSFGPETDSRVRDFQRQKGLTADGVVGSGTWPKLIVQVHNGSTGDAVRGAQTQLNKYGYGLAVDGKFGPATTNATRDFQSKKGLKVDGYIGPNTWHALVSGSGGGGGERETLARSILNNSRITLATVHVSGVKDNATARQNIIDTAAGKPAARSSYGNAPGGSVFLDPRTLNGMLSLAQSYTYSVSEIAGGSHSSTSRHYDGVAIDVNYINGVHVGSGNQYYRAFMQKCRDLGATQVYGPGDSGHSTHIHCAWPR